MKYLVVALVVIVVLWLMFGLQRRKPGPPAAGKPSGPGRAGPPERMLSCAHCGMHLPRGDALIAAGQAYCCAEHRDAGPRDDG